MHDNSLHMNYDLIKLLSEEYRYVSEKEIGEKLGISGDEIKENIEKLRESLYRIEFSTNHGYRLDPSSDALNEYEIRYDNLLYKEETDSTNEECKRQFARGCRDRLLVVSSYQSAGKGRLGRIWQTEKNAGISMSIITIPDIKPVEAHRLTLVTGIAVRRVLSDISGLDLLIKWPNDIVINGRKTAGILTEMSAETDKVSYIITGIGINVNNAEFPETIRDKATSLYIETGQKFRRSDIINRIVPELLDCFDITEKEGFGVFRDEYNEHCANVNREVKTVGADTEIKGIAKGVNDNGELVISSGNGEETILSGEVSVRLDDNRYI